MISIRSNADFDRAMADPMDRDLRRLLTLRRDQLLTGADADLGELVHLIAANRRDTLAAVEAEAGFPLVGKEAPIEWVQLHPCGWVEAAAMLTDDFALAVFVRNCVSSDPALLLPLLARA